MLAILGIIILYTTGHMFFIHYKAPAERTQYEKIISIVAIVAITLVYIGLMID